jgi:hypothetical protein
LNHLAADAIVILPPVGTQTFRTIFDTGLCVGKVSAALISQGIQGAVAEQTTEGFGVCLLMAGEIFTLLVLEKIIMGHCLQQPPLV